MQIPEPVEATAEKPTQANHGIDMVSIYRAVLRVVAHLEESDYTGENSRQDEVLKHDDLPDPASRKGNSQG